jgi:hypothetical protein
MIRLGSSQEFTFGVLKSSLGSSLRKAWRNCPAILVEVDRTILLAPFDAENFDDPRITGITSAS